jgi:2-desacetyl-2-hydroxyethyl bacteriochlorophyllide A dehydrogenase
MAAGHTLPQEACALWYVAPGEVELRTEKLNPAGTGDILVRTLFSAASRGTERLVLNGAIPAEEWPRMRAPMQEGDFPFPVKYGYCATGRVEQGPTDLMGAEVFVLHPHQEVFLAPASMAVRIPAGIPARRATLAANMETALNAVWDSAVGPADTVVIVGAGVVGLLAAYLAARIPGTRVIVTDVQPERREIAASFGAQFVAPDDVRGAEADVVFHASATEAGLTTALSAAGMEATVVEMSWHGTGSVRVPLGGAFHSQRLKLISSQVGQVSPGHRSRWTHHRRQEAAMALLNDDRLDQLLGEDIAFSDVPKRWPGLLRSSAGLPPIIRY